MNLVLNGYVVADADQWVYDFLDIPAFCPAKVRQALRDNPDGEDLVLEVNSCGGSVFAGFEMYSVLREFSGHTVAHIQSLAGSAASTLVLGCDEVMLSPVAQLMIHLPAVTTQGSQREHRESIQALDSITTSVINAYALRCGGKTTREHLAQLMEGETWIPAQDAISMGLADGYLLQDGEDPSLLHSSVTNMVGAGIRSIVNATAMPDFGTLVVRYEQMVRDGAAPVPGHPVEGVTPADGEESTHQDPPQENAGDDWRRSARLAIEKNRF